MDYFGDNIGNIIISFVGRFNIFSDNGSTVWIWFEESNKYELFRIIDQKECGVDTRWKVQMQANQERHRFEEWVWMGSFMYSPLLDEWVEIKKSTFQISTYNPFV